MNAGLPTTGLGGIFYVFSTIVMFVLELVRTIKGQSSFFRWKIVLMQTSLMILILVAIWVTGFVLSLLVPQQIARLLAPVSASSAISQNTQALFLTPFVLLACLLGSTQIIRLYAILLARTKQQSKK